LRRPETEFREDCQDELVDHIQEAEAEFWKEQRDALTERLQEAESEFWESHPYRGKE
jgi:hypothetical protein